MTRHVRVPRKLKFRERKFIGPITVNFYYESGHVFGSLSGFYMRCHMCYKERVPSQYENSQYVAQCPASSPSLDGHRHRNSRTCLHTGHTFHWCRRLSPRAQRTLKIENVDVQLDDCKSQSLLVPSSFLVLENFPFLRILLFFCSQFYTSLCWVRTWVW